VQTEVTQLRNLQSRRMDPKVRHSIIAALKQNENQRKLELTLEARPLAVAYASQVAHIEQQRVAGAATAAHA
jgi:hypothetical protein